ncbi:unnamed protein product [Symbiodinium sp. CCMP2592]|nr:unnamed protein product [Symbiodinium sp. CCMP2592]
MDAGIRNIMEDMDACTTTPHSPTGDRISRLLEQMRTCVLVHHQLSCLLIHASALDAGIYGDAASFDESTEEGNDALRRSIQSLGGSTARLFCMALQDQKDLRSMSHTLQSRVESMVEGLQTELGLTSDADCSGALAAEVADLEVALAQKHAEVQELRHVADDRRQRAEEKRRAIVMQQAARVRAAERRLQVLQHAWDNLEAAGLDASAAKSQAAQAAQALLGPRSPSPDGPGGRQTLRRQQHENQLERRYSPVTRRVHGAAPQAVVQTTPQPIVGGSRIPATAPDAVKPQQAFSSLAQLDAQLRAAQTEFWSL